MRTLIGPPQDTLAIDDGMAQIPSPLGVDDICRRVQRHKRARFYPYRTRISCADTYRRSKAISGKALTCLACRLAQRLCGRLRYIALRCAFGSALALTQHPTPYGNMSLGKRLKKAFNLIDVEQPGGVAPHHFLLIISGKGTHQLVQG